VREEEEAVFSGCRVLVPWVPEHPALPGEEAPRGTRQLPGQWPPEPGLLAQGPPEEEEEEEEEDQHHAPWKGNKKDCEQLLLCCPCAEHRGHCTRFLHLL